MTPPAKKGSISELQAELSLGKMGLAVEEIDHPVFVIWVDDFKFAYINESASEFIGLEPEFFYGKTTSELGAYFGSDNLENHYSPLLTQNVRSITYEAEHLNMNGENIPVEVLSQIVKPADGRSFIVNISRDISKRKNAEKQKSEFMSTMIHELRTPITSIKGALGLIQAGVVGELSDKARNLIDISNRNSETLIRLIADMLDSEKSEAGMLNYQFEDFNLAALIEESVAVNQSYADKYKVNYRVFGTQNALEIRGDYGRVMQIMANLLSNAAKFSNSGDDVHVAILRDNNSVRISIKDFGLGIPQTAQASIFDKFTQVASQNQRDKGGTGLGLGIAKAIVEAHGWSISFASQEGKGTEFIVEIPK